jgi:type VI secretion system secreted protein VgrG
MSKVPHSLEKLFIDYQHARILRLTFPNNDAPQSKLLVNKLDADKELSRDFESTVELLSDNASLDLKDLQGKLP